MARDRMEMRDALDRFGADLSSWPDPALAAEARRLALADRGFRARLDAAAGLAAGLAGLRDEMDAAIRASGAEGRVAAAVLSALPERAVPAGRWRMVAAAVVVAAALGAVADLTFLAPDGGASYEVVVLDPLFLDPSGTLAP